MGWSARIISFWILWIPGVGLKAADTLVQQQNVDSIWWTETTKDLAYAPEKMPEFERMTNNNFDFFNFGNVPGLKWVALFVIVAALLFVLYKLFGKEWFSGDFDDETDAQHLLTEDDLDDRFYEMNLEQLLAKALKDKQWAMAIRIRFLMALKSLIDQQLIFWHKDLTNNQIAYQLKSAEDRMAFRNLISHYEKAWYGDIPVSLEVYNQTVPSFDAFRKINPENE